ncbi:hypothetical protein THMIRHAM_08810 [Thiomicrorhabdus immobilis]|uniref:DUF218 domain-containing protein n=1 Tax=Thiomicrorhabdus immobilis TaxID=2791037 RepID=A0ABM7MCN2_9GAMM|nr:YdcF family protein [Thiomicrorhabdus immobilis]BCN93096.1 hypothetical protein THMIRHAM_08810 [Thiomicrorhabdus immobilis]
MLSLSFIWAAILLGLPLIWQFYQAYKVASKTVIPKETIGTWIIFGKKLQQNQIDLEYKQRIIAAYQALENLHPKTLIFQGGFTHTNTVSEAQAGLKYFNSLFTEARLCQKKNVNILVEDKSRNTLENLKQTRKLLLEQQVPLEVVVISNRYHLLRCSIIAKNLGFTSTFLPAETTYQLNLSQLYKLSLEALFLNWYHTGLFISKILNNQRMLNKVL